MVRPAVGADAAGIAHVHVQAWRETYAHLVPADTLAALDEAARAERWERLIAAETPEAWVATDGGAVIGWATTGHGHDEDAPRPLELEGIYVLASHHGSGAGQRLLDAAVGGHPAYLWVADDNPRARAFYTRNGFVPDGLRTRYPLAGTPVDVIRMVR